MTDSGGCAGVGFQLGGGTASGWLSIMGSIPLPVASEGFEPSPQESKSCVRPLHREAELIIGFDVVGIAVGPWPRLSGFCVRAP